MSSSVLCLHPSHHTWDTASQNSDTIPYVLSTTHLTQWSQEWGIQLSMKINPNNKPSRLANILLRLRVYSRRTKSSCYWGLSLFPSVCFWDFLETKLDPLFLVALFGFSPILVDLILLSSGESQSLYSRATERGGHDIGV